MSRVQAEPLIEYLLDKYEDKLKDAPAGETFEKLYDQEKLEPIPSYQKLYDEVKQELRERGLLFREKE
jgi:hypothetical protein